MLRAWFTHKPIDVTRYKLAPKRREPEEDEVLVQHVGDGEYPFNIFGAVYDNWHDFASNLMDSDDRLYAYRYDKKYETVHVYRVPTIKHRSQTVRHCFRVARVTYEKINPNEAPRGG